MKGFFFGSFDPPHIGHLNVVTTALNSGIVDKVTVVLAYKSVWKNTETFWDYRLNMCRMFFDEVPNVDTSSIEFFLAKRQPLPTYKVIDFLREQEKEDFYIITTNETYKEIPLWQEGERILKENKFLIVSSYHFPEVTVHGNEDQVIYAPDITVCSTNLREKIKSDLLVQPFITTDVLRYIHKLNLYK